MILKLYEKNNSRRDIDRIVDILNQGGVIIYLRNNIHCKS